MDRDRFWDTAKENFEAVKKWSKWEQKIVINSTTIDNGQFTMSEEEWKKRYCHE